ncbi:hypothetical protein Aph01nite_60710 [Acrocarpospora phusangensis]|uniref:Integrin-like protein n=1 Tax=Acrocarpospora phusangensis TaxID=1070424 RepID=A0A919QF83_9ACTN|nr:integrin alpha [Acrocarpospora phusangensis]GIH27761.1 hypothetical protein Aph01nite_60710 [Acrocarpospora phusangensis]
MNRAALAASLAALLIVLPTAAVASATPPAAASGLVTGRAVLSTTVLAPGKTTVVAPGKTAARADCPATAGPADFNGDGLVDAVAGDPFADVDGVEGAGVVQVLLGGASEQSKDGLPGLGGTLELRGPDPEPGAGFGWAVRTAHVNDDKCLDVIVGAPYTGDDDSGAAYVFFGTASGDAEVLPLEAEKQAESHFGWSVASADLSGGGAVIAVGQPHADEPADAGAVHVFDVGDTVRSAKRLNQENEGVIGNGEVGDMWGWSLAVGNLGGDPGKPDLAVGAPYENNDGTGIQVASGKIDSGMVAVVFDVLEDGPYTSRKWDLNQATKDVVEKSGNRFGWSLAYGEWGDAAYLAVSLPLSDQGSIADTGAIQLYERKGSGELEPSRTIRMGVGELKFPTIPVVKGAAIGWSMAFVNPTGTPVLAIGEPYATVEGAAESGRVRFAPVRGGESGDGLDFAESQPYQHFGWSLAAYGNPDGVTPGLGLVIGIPDRKGGGAVATRALGPATLIKSTLKGTADLGRAVG